MTVERKYRNIPVTSHERKLLDEAKNKYEAETGQTGDWGRFLIGATLAGLAGLGIYKLLTTSKRRPKVECPSCGQVFPIVVSGELPPVAKIACPECSEEFVVRFSAD